MSPSIEPAASAAALTDAGTASIAEALARLRGVLGRRPEAGEKSDAPATATLVSGLSVSVTGPDGQHVRTGMPATAGGDGDGPTPGWLMRAGMAACTATAIRMYAAEQGIALDRLQVTVRSASDVRGLLGMDGVSAAMHDLCTEVEVEAAGVPEATLRELVERAHRHSPTASTVAAGVTGRLRVDVVG
jgi:uncharacterized OsmC-like protein